MQPPAPPERRTNSREEPRIGPRFSGSAEEMAICLTTDLPSPASKILAYPTKAHISIAAPKRAVSSSRAIYPSAGNATTAGRAEPIRLEKEFFKRLKPTSSIWKACDTLSTTQQKTPIEGGSLFAPSSSKAYLLEYFLKRNSSLPQTSRIHYELARMWSDLSKFFVIHKKNHDIRLLHSRVSRSKSQVSREFSRELLDIGLHYKYSARMRRNDLLRDCNCRALTKVVDICLECQAETCNGHIPSSLLRLFLKNICDS